MKRHLLFAMLCIVGALKINVQQEPVSGTAYYLYNVETGTFMTRGNTWGTQAVSYEYGLPWQVTINNGAYTLRMYDIVSDNNTSGLGDNGYSDNGSPISMTLEGSANGYKLKFGSNYVAAVAGAKAYTIDVNGSATGNSTWQFLTENEYQTKLAERKANQEAAVASAAGLTLTGTLAQELATWAATDKTSSVGNNGLPSSSTWTLTSVANRGGNKNWGTYGGEIYQGGGTYSKTITGLTPGIYKVGVKALFRSAGNGVCVTVGNAGYTNSDAYFVANGNSVQIKDWYSGQTNGNNPNSTGEFVTKANAGNYYSEVYCYVGTDGKLELSAVSESFWGASWFLFGGVTLTQYVNSVSAEQAAALLAEVEQYENAAVPTAALVAMAAAKAAFQQDQSVANYQNLSDKLQVVKDWVNAYASAKAYLDRMAETLDNTNFYTAASYEQQYGQWKTKYEEKTLTLEEASGLTEDAAWNTGWHASNNIDDVLLSVWTIGGTQCSNYSAGMYINTWSTEGNSDGSNFKVPFFEYWVGSGSLAANTIQSTLVGLEENQLYSVEILVRTGSKGNANSIRLQVGEGTEVDLTAGEQIGSTGRYMKNFVAMGYSDDNGNLTVTITVDENSNVSWLSFKNAKYQAIDDERIPYAEQLAAKVAEAQGLVNTLVVPDGVKTALGNTAGAYDGFTYESFETVQEFVDAIAEVQAAIDDAQAAETTYAQYQTLKSYAQTLLETPYTELVTGAHDTYAAAVTEPTLNTKAEIDAAYEALNAATMTYVANADPAEGSQFDLTFWLVNPDVTSFWDGTWGVVPAGWYTDQNPADNFQVMSNNEMGPNGEVFIEYWSGSAKTSGFVLYQKVTLPEGTYHMTGRVGLLQTDGGNPAPTPNANMTFSANDVDGSQIAVGPLADQEVEFINTQEQEVKIGLKAQAGNTYHWIGINNIKLYKEATDNTEYNILTDVTNATVAVTVEGVEATTAKKLDAVNFSVTLEEGVNLESVAVTYVDGDNTTQTITPTDLGEGNYTFQMPAFDVTINVVASVDKSELLGVINDANAFDQTSVTQYVYDLLSAALGDAQAVYDDADATATEVANAQQALFGALQDAQNFAVPYSAYLELKDYADALVAVPSDNRSAQETLETDIAGADASIEGVSSADEAADINAALRQAMDTYAAQANPVGDGAKFNLSYMFVNGNLEGLPTWQPCDGWYTEQYKEDGVTVDGNSQVMTNDKATSEDGTKTAFYEYWSYTAKSNGKFTLYQPVTLPEGYYEMSCYAFAKQQDDPANTGDVKGVFFYANETQGTVVDTDRLSQKSIEFKNPTEQEVKIGLKAINPNTYNWMGIGYLELYKIPSKSLVIDPDDEDYDYTTEGAYDVILYRPIKAGYNTIVLPFSMTQEEVEDAFGQGSQVAVVKYYDSEKTHLAFDIQQGIVANRPCLLNAGQAYGDADNPYEFTFEGRTLVSAEDIYPSYSVSGATMFGTYETQTYVPQYSWFVQSGQLVYAPNGTDCWVGLTRGWITLDNWIPDSSGVKGLTVSFEDGTTGIAVIENGEMNILTGKIYDLSGREVQNPTRGIYIINGKKVMIK